MLGAASRRCGGRRSSKVPRGRRADPVYTPDPWGRSEEGRLGWRCVRRWSRCWRRPRRRSRLSVLMSRLPMSRSSTGTGCWCSPPQARAGGCCSRPAAASWSRTRSLTLSPLPGSCRMAWSLMARSWYGTRRPARLAGCRSKRCSSGPPHVPAPHPPWRRVCRPSSWPSTSSRPTGRSCRRCRTWSAGAGWRFCSRPAA